MFYNGFDFTCFFYKKKQQNHKLFTPHSLRVNFATFGLVHFIVCFSVRVGMRSYLCGPQQNSSWFALHTLLPAEALYMPSNILQGQEYTSSMQGASIGCIHTPSYQSLQWMQPISMSTVAASLPSQLFHFKHIHVEEERSRDLQSEFVWYSNTYHLIIM